MTAALAELQDPKPTAQDEPKKDKAPLNKQLEERKKNFQARKRQQERAAPKMPKTAAYNLDTTRHTRPSLPEGRGKINARQGAGYDDPVPTSTTNFPAYFTKLTKAINDTGLVGSKPLQQVDPTISVSTIGGFSHNLLSHNLNFTAPVLALAGRGGLNLGLGLSYNSNVLAVTSSFAIDTSEPGYDSNTDWKWTTAEFDGMGRTAALEKSDNTYIFNDYSVCGCAGGLVTNNYDERSNRKTTESDFLGRLQYAREYAPEISLDSNFQPYISDYILHAEVEYQYDALDRLTTIIQRGNAGANSGKWTGPGQTRSFAYDTWGARPERNDARSGNRKLYLYDERPSCHDDECQ